MMHHARSVCAAVTLLFLLPHEAAAQRQVTIWITKPKLIGNVNAAHVDPIYHAVLDQVRDLFPCARVLTDAFREATLSHERDRSKLGYSDDQRTQDSILDMMWADFIISMNFGAIGTTHYMSTTAVGVAPLRTMSSMSAADGLEWSSPTEFVEATVAPLRKVAYEVCPWVGTITYTRTAKETLDTSERSTEPQMGGTTASVTRTAKVKNVETESFTFTLTRGRRRGVRITTTGSASMQSESEQGMQTANKTCFPQDAAGAVVDKNLKSGVDDLLVDKQTSNGSARAPLLSPKAVLTQFEGTWMLAVDGRAEGEGSATSTSERSGGCGTWSKIHPADTGPAPYGRLVSFLVDNLREVKGELAGTYELIAVEGERADVTFKLTRK